MRDELETMPLRVSCVREAAPGIRSFLLRHPDGAELPPFEAGAHLQVEVCLATGAPAWRSYSLLGDARERHSYRIAVRLDEHGGGSRYLHDQVRPGDVLRVSPPVNGFPLAPDRGHSILIAGGIGITAILGMARTLVHEQRSVELHFVAHTESQLAFRDEIQSLLGARAHFYVTRAPSPRRLVVADLLRASVRPSHLYVCGPSGLTRDVKAHASALGWPPSAVHAESFGVGRNAGARALTLHLERSARTIHVAESETILDALLDAGIWVPFDCRRGECATCMTRVVAGTVDHRDVCLTPALQATHLCPCVSRAHSVHLTLDL